MVIANLMASVLALAMVGASTAAVSKVENNSAGSDVVLNADVHKAYYDPAETYGTTSGKIYNYSSCWMVAFDEGEGVTDLGVDAGASSSYSIYSLNEDYTHLVGLGGNGYACFFKFSDTEEPDLDSADWVVPNYSVDVYFGGEPISSFGYTESEFFYIDIDSASSYIWVFDHQEADPYTGVDMLGDIAEGLTGGIVPVAEGIGSGLQSLVQDIFLNASHDGLSVFGIVTICFCGLALALGLSRWVLNFVNSLGSRDR